MPEQKEIEIFINEMLKLGIEPITENDAQLYSEFFQKDKREFCYANSWFYLTQAVNGVGKHSYPLGFKYLTDNCLITVGIFESSFTKKMHFHIVNPLGEEVTKNVDELAQALYNITETPVYIKKIEDSLVQELMEKSTYCQIEKKNDNLSPYSWHKDAPLEDDTYPEIIIEINATLNLPRKENQGKDKYHRFENRNKGNSIEWIDVDENNIEDAKLIIKKFFKYKFKNFFIYMIKSFFRYKKNDISTPDDYSNMITTIPQGEINKDYIKKIIYINKKPLAFVCTEQINHESCHGLYANVCLYQESKWLSEYVMIETSKLLNDLGIRYLNMGGSETKGLDDFKRKFLPKPERKFPSEEKNSYWIVFDRK